MSCFVLYLRFFKQTMSTGTAEGSRAPATKCSAVVEE